MSRLIKRQTNISMKYIKLPEADFPGVAGVAVFSLLGIPAIFSAIFKSSTRPGHTAFIVYEALYHRALEHKYTHPRSNP